MNKLPQITLAFWVMKICATTLGETAGDLLSMTLNVGYAISSMILISVFLVTLVTQLWSKAYNPVLWKCERAAVGGRTGPRSEWL